MIGRVLGHAIAAGIVALMVLALFLLALTSIPQGRDVVYVPVVPQGSTVVPRPDLPDQWRL